MLYENAFLKTFNNEFNKLLIREESQRKEIATMIYGFYTNNKPLINHYIKEYMTNSSVADLKIWDSKSMTLHKVQDESNPVGMFTEKTVKIMPKIHIDLVNKVLDLVCTIYNAGADRYLLDSNSVINEIMTERLMDIYNGVNFPKKINSIYKQGYLFNTILVQPVWRNEKIDLDIITPNFCSVVGYDEDFSKEKIVMINKSIGEEDMVSYWTDTEHYYLNANDEKIAIEGNDEMVNPYGLLPFAKLQFTESSDYWGEPHQDLIENNIWYDVREMNSYFVEMFQGLGVGLGVNLSKNGIVSLSPNTMILVDGVTDSQVPPSIDFASTGAPLTELRDSIDYMYKRIGNSKGLSSQSMSNDVSDQSGIAKAYDSAELSIKKDSHKIVMKAFEKELYSKIKLVWNYHNPGLKFDEKLEFKVDIIEDEPMINVSDEIEITQFKLDNNMTSIVDLMIKDNPDLTTEEAELRLLENKKNNDKYLTNLKNSNGKENSKEEDDSEDTESGDGRDGSGGS